MLVRKLIVNADDLGADGARNRGILEAIEAGRVTSVSVLVNGGASHAILHSIKKLHQKHISVGIHLNLSEGRPLTGGLSNLVGKEGLFLGKWAAHEVLRREDDARLEWEIKAEAEAQIAMLAATGIRITHLDGHQHVHIFPAAVRPVIEIALKYRIPWVRIPHEPHPRDAATDRDATDMDEANLFSDLAKAARPYFVDAGMVSTDHFRGLRLKGRLSKDEIDRVLDGLPAGLAELMVHPGRAPRRLSAGPFSGFSTIDRERELETLLSPAFPDAIDRNNVILIPFQEVLS